MKFYNVYRQTLSAGCAYANNFKEFLFLFGYGVRLKDAESYCEVFTQRVRRKIIELNVLISGKCWKRHRGKRWTWTRGGRIITDMTSVFNYVYLNVFYTRPTTNSNQDEKKKFLSSQEFSLEMLLQNNETQLKV